MINKITNCTKRNITGSFQNIAEVVEFIKSPNPEHIILVEQSRTLDRKSKEYNDIKIHKLPAITINFNFINNYITGKNVSQSTGYLYLDVDGMTEKDLEINTTYVCAYWRSLSNTGITLVIKVEGLTPDNFKEATKEIADLLNIPYDSKAVSIDRLTVLSYDSNAYYNDNTEIIPVSELNLAEAEQEKSCQNIGEEKRTHFNTTLEYKKIGYDCNGFKNGRLRFNNLDELISKLDIAYDENGLYDFGKDNKLKYAQLFIPFRKIVDGERENILKSITYQLVALNKNANKELIFKYLNSINSSKMFPPLGNGEVQKTLNKIYKKINDVEPIYNATRRFIYDVNKNLTTKEKKRLNIKKICQDRVEKTKADLWSVMKEWNDVSDGKMTIKKIKNLTGKNKKTVQKYYTELKELLFLISNDVNTNKNKIIEHFHSINPSLKDLDDLMKFDFK